MSTATELIQKVSKDASGRLTTLAGEASEFIRKHPVTSAVTVGGGVLAATQVIRIVKKRKKASATKKRKKKTTKRTSRKGKRSKLSWQLDRARISKEKHEVAYQRRKKLKSKRTTKKRVGVTYYTKNGQPYKILANGRARFIKGKRRKR